MNHITEKRPPCGIMGADIAWLGCVAAVSGSSRRVEATPSVFEGSNPVLQRSLKRKAIKPRMESVQDFSVLKAYNARNAKVLFPARC